MRILQHFDTERHISIETVFSDYAISEVTRQLTQDGSGH